MVKHEPPLEESEGASEPSKSEEPKELAETVEEPPTDETEDRDWKMVVGTLVASIIITIAGSVVVIILTDYESFESVRFKSYDVGLDFILHLRTNGPFSTYKDVTVSNIQVLGWTEVPIDSLRLTVWGVLWQMECTREVNYDVDEEVNEIWRSPCQERTLFTESGPQNMSASLWTNPGEWQSIDYSASERDVYVLPKDVDNNWLFGRLAAIGVVAAAALTGIPSVVKTYRDLYEKR